VPEGRSQPDRPFGREARVGLMDEVVGGEGHTPHLASLPDGGDGWGGGRAGAETGQGLAGHGWAPARVLARAGAQRRALACPSWSGSRTRPCRRPGAWSAVGMTARASRARAPMDGASWGRRGAGTRSTLAWDGDSRRPSAHALPGETRGACWPCGRLRGSRGSSRRDRRSAGTGCWGRRARDPCPASARG
jgi:hypothetical protein